MSAYSNFLQEIKTKISALEFVKAYPVSVITQDDAELATLLEQRLDAFNGLVVVVCVESQKGEYPAIDMTWSLVITEAVPINRERADFITALDLAERIKVELDCHQYRWLETTHQFSEDSITIATARYRALLSTK